MAKKTKDDAGFDTSRESGGTTQPAETIEEAANPAAEMPVYFGHVMWKGVREVLKCAKCGTFRDDRDAMIEHVLLHYPVEERERMLEILLKEK